MSRPRILWVYIALSVLLHGAVIALLPGKRSTDPFQAPPRFDVSLRSQPPATITPPVRGTGRTTKTPPREPTEAITPAPEVVERQPRLDLDVAKMVRGLARERGEATVADLNAPRLTEQAKFGLAFAATARPDCRVAHADKGPVLAVVFLLADLVTDTGCNW